MRKVNSSGKISGDTVLPQEQIERMVLIKKDNTFSRALLELSTDSITMVLGNIGYAFAEVTPMPEVNREDHTVSLNFVVKPGPRVTAKCTSPGACLPSHAASRP